MEALKESQFTLRYNRIMFITFSVVISLLTVLTVIQIRNEIASFEHQQVDLFREESKALDELLGRITAHLELLQTKAETYFLDTDSVDSSKLFQTLSQKDDTFYNLDNIPSPYSESNLGNLTGKGKIADFSPSLRAEVGMALSLNSLFQATKNNIPNSAWIYYTSKDNFINIYPWVPSENFQFSQELYTHEFYTWGLPSANPDRKGFWTPVYLDEYGEGVMVTAAKPVYRGDEFIGTVAIDITLDKLSKYIHEFKKTGGMLMIVNERNQLITHSNLMSSKNDSKIYELADGLPGPLRSEAASLFENPPMQLARYTTWSTSYLYIWSRPENAEDWRFVFITEGRQNIFVQIVSSVGLELFILLAALGIMLFSTKKITSQEFIRPAENLVRHIAKESANEPSPLPDLPAQWIPWFNEISRIFTENRNLIKEIIETTAAKERIESELNVAREIQMGTLPTDFTFEPEHKELDIYAYILPAREVGGDLYDFFFVDEEHLCFTLGDVAGKGVPAALFMVITKELISNNVLLGNLSPADVMTWINEMLYRGNPSAMFVTLVIGIMNVKTGIVHYANGGHVPPIFVGCGENAPCYKKELSGPVVGVIPGVTYKDISVTLQPGEAFFLCSDGVTEAMNEEEKLFGDKRLLENFTRMKDSSSREAIEGVLREVRKHAGNAPQSDDIAMMMIRWNPDGQSEET